MSIPEDHILVIFGASGDLTKRKLMPALLKLKEQNLLPNNFAVLGVSRTEYQDENYRGLLREKLAEKKVDTDVLEEFLQNVYYQALNTKDPADYVRLKEKLESLRKEKNLPANYVYYLATPPSLYEIIPQALAKHALHIQAEGAYKRIIIEKPFGYDLASAKALNKSILLNFSEDQVYRIDHYLGKETVQNIMVTRFSNGIFEPLWNRNYIDHVEITSSESIGTEGRGGYYESSGALRDMVQNHLLQLLAVIAMEPPTINSSTAIRNETLKVFQAIRPFSDDEMRTNLIRGQYVASNIRNKAFTGYREEEGVNPDSRTETYAALKIFVDNWRWGGVPFYIRTGKRLPTRVTEAVIHFKATPHRLFCPDKEYSNSDNQLVIRIQPDEGLLMKFGMKVPGAGFNVQPVNMDFHYSDLEGQLVPEAYQRLLLDAMNGDATLYARGDAVIEAWKFIDSILKYWADNPQELLHGYPSGTWGPSVADNLIEGDNITWRYPCKNLAGDGLYCDL